ncbi:hypothetical protein C8R43DRAFT_1127514 [Mycena crocata]|nr:hypothetical protein C8R43DRAFT_1127514 [Mycena crocata]
MSILARESPKTWTHILFWYLNMNARSTQRSAAYGVGNANPGCESISAVPLLVTGAVGVVLVTAVGLTPLDAAAANFAVDAHPSSRLSILTNLLHVIAAHSPPPPTTTSTTPQPFHRLRNVSFRFFPPYSSAPRRQYPQNRFNARQIPVAGVLTIMVTSLPSTIRTWSADRSVSGPRSSKPRHSLRSPNPGRDSASNFGAPVALTFRSFAAGVGLVFNLWRQNFNMRHDCLNASKFTVLQYREITLGSASMVFPVATLTYSYRFTFNPGVGSWGLLSSWYVAFCLNVAPSFKINAFVSRIRLDADGGWSEGSLRCDFARLQTSSSRLYLLARVVNAESEYRDYSRPDLASVTSLDLGTIHPVVFVNRRVMHVKLETFEIQYMDAHLKYNRLEPEGFCFGPQHRRYSVILSKSIHRLGSNSASNNFVRGYFKMPTFSHPFDFFKPVTVETIVLLQSYGMQGESHIGSPQHICLVSNPWLRLLALALALALQRYSTFYSNDYNLTSRRFTQDPNRNPEMLF